MRSFIGIIVIGLLCVSCGDDHIDEYTTVKINKPAPGTETAEAPITTQAESSAAPAVLSAEAIADPNAIVWPTMKAWTSQGASGMRMASYQIPDGGDLSVISLGGDGGGLLANINRWRNQVGLEPITEAQIKQETTSIKSAVGEFIGMKLVNSANKDKAICGTVLMGKQYTLFVKLTANADCVEKHTQSVFDFCAQASAK